MSNFEGYGHFRSPLGVEYFGAYKKHKRCGEEVLKESE
jgi:hypothetical protein